MTCLVLEPVQKVLAASSSPNDEWLFCDGCRRFFQYRNARRPAVFSRWGCPFCDVGDIEVFAWDAKRPKGESPWPSSCGELTHGMEAPDLESFYTERAEQTRAGVVEAFGASSRWRALRRDDWPRWVEHMLYMYWTWDYPPEAIDSSAFIEDWTELYAFWSDALPDDATDIVAELAAYFGFAVESLGHSHAAACAAIVRGAGAEALLRRAITKSIVEKRRRAGCSRPVRGATREGL